MGQARTKPMSLEQFLEWEEQQEARYEFVDGRIVMMSGGTVAHDEVRLSIAAALRAKLAGSPCRAHLDVKLVCENGTVRYPDVAVVCGPRDPKATRLINPLILVEVLSPSTQATDYIRKAADYSSVPSVAVYLLVNPNDRHVDVLRRIDGALTMPFKDADPLIDDNPPPPAAIELPEIGVTLTLDDIYGSLA